MGTDRSELARTPCPCGQGEIVVTHCEPDHPWPTKSKWLETSLDCKSCRETYALEDRSGWNDLGPVVLVECSEVAARAKRQAAYKSAAAELMSSPGVQNLVERFVRRLEAEPSVAALYRLLEANRLIVETEGTFRKKLKRLGEPEGWARDHAQYYFRLPDIIILLGSDEPAVAAAVARVKALSDAASAEIPIVGQPIVKRFPK